MLALSVILLIYVTLSVGAGDRELLGYRFFMVTTGSMSGSIEQGEFIVTRAVARQELAVGDVITFVSQDAAIYGQNNTHRIVGAEGGRYTTKGDANPVPDSAPVAYEDILGKVVFHSAAIGAVIRAVSRPINMLFLIVIPILIIAILDIISGIRKIARERKEERDTPDEHPEHPAETESPAERP